MIDLATQDGLKVILVCGNHDPEYGVSHVWKHNKKILITHGHIAFPGVAPWSWRSKHIQKARRGYLDSTGDGFEEQFSATKKASIDAATGKFKSHTPSKFRYLCIAIPSAIHVLIGWLTFPTRIHNWAQKYAPSAQIIITGHTHHAGIWKRGTQTIVNTGCFGFPSHPRAVVIENELVVVHKLRCNEGRYSLGKICASLNVR